jgi:outer membrane protein W
MKKQFLLLTLLFLFFSAGVIAQTDSCIVKMKNASTSFEQGNYDDAIKLLVSTLANCPLGTDDKIEANKLLIRSYIAIDNLELANKAAAAIMKLNPNYKPDKFKDDPKLSALFEKYKPVPVFDIGISGGVNFPFIHVINTYSVVHADDATGLATYKNKLGFQLGVQAEYKVYKDFWVEAGFQFRETSYEHDLDSIEGETVTYVEKMTYFDFPVSLKYYFLKKKIHPYLQAGADFSFLSSALSTTSRSGESDIVDRTSLRNTFSVGYFGAVGCSYKYNSFLFFADVRYIYFPQQVNKADTRYDDPINLWKYYYIDDDFSMNNMQANVGASFILKYKNVKL